MKIHDIDISEKHPISQVVFFNLGVSEMRNVLLRCLVLFPLCAVCTPSFAGDVAFGPIITSDNLEKILETDKPLILDIRGNNVKDGYIPGAISVSYSAFRGPKNNPGQLVTNASTDYKSSPTFPYIFSPHIFPNLPKISPNLPTLGRAC